MAFYPLIFSTCFVLASAISIDDCPKDLPRDDTLAVHGGSCYRFEVKTTAIYPDAQKICRSQGGDIAIVKDQATNNFLQDKAIELKMNKTFIWIGLRLNEYYGGFFWEDGTYPDYQNFKDSYVNEEHRCTAMSPTTGLWDNFLCETTFGYEDERARYVCEYPITPRNDSRKDCPFYDATESVIQRLDDKCYYFSPIQSLYFQAERHCSSLDGSLVQIKSEKIQTFLKKSLDHMSKMTDEALWIGLSWDRKHWLDGSPATYKNFDPRPHFLRLQEDYCQAINEKRNRKWGVYYCGRAIPFAYGPELHMYICEFDVIKPH